MNDCFRDAQPAIGRSERLAALEKLELPVWVEDESQKIGCINIPKGFFNQIAEQTVYFIDIPKEKRAEYLVNEYSGFDNAEISYAITGIAKRLGISWRLLAKLNNLTTPYILYTGQKLRLP